MPAPEARQLAREMADMSPELLAETLSEAAREVRYTQAWKGGRSDVARWLRRAAECARGIAERRAVGSGDG